MDFDSEVVVKSHVKLLLYNSEEYKRNFWAKAGMILKVKALEKHYQENLKSSVKVMGIHSPVKCIISFSRDYSLLC